MDDATVSAVILAAGRATRFGGEKLTIDYRGRPLLAHVLGTVAQAVREGTLSAGLVVLRPQSQAILNLVREAGLTPVANPDADLGLSTSLRAGLASAATSGAAAVLVIPGDQPHLKLEVMARLIQAWRAGQGPVIRPRYNEEGGAPNHPVLLDSSVWCLAFGLTGDNGFASVLHSQPDLITTIEVPGRNPDMDTPQDLIQSFPSP